MTTVSSSLKFSNLRWNVNEDTRLSISHFPFGTGHTYAVALLRKCGTRWEVVQDTAAEFSGDAKDIVRDDAGYRATAYGAKLAASVIGELPLRFFRDAVV
jgi:hypothetical protein